MLAARAAAIPMVRRRGGRQRALRASCARRRPYLWYAAGVLEQTEIEISAHFEVRPDLLIPIYFKDFSLQAPLLKKLHWVIHTDGQFRGYSTESYSSGKPTRLTKEEKAARVCPEDIKEVITGMVIGDSCIIFSARLWQR